MSWQSYIDDQLLATGKIKDAVICGHDGNIWAKSQNLPATAAELSTIMTHFSNVDHMAMNGVVLGGVKYMYLSAVEGSVVRAKKGKSGLHMVKTVQAALVCVYEEPNAPEDVATVTERLGDYLISVGY